MDPVDPWRTIVETLDGAFLRAADEIFPARLSNPHARTAYAHQVGRFLASIKTEDGYGLRDGAVLGTLI